MNYDLKKVYWTYFQVLICLVMKCLYFNKLVFSNQKQMVFTSLYAEHVVIVQLCLIHRHAVGGMRADMKVSAIYGF